MLIKYLKYDGQELPYRVSYYALKRATEKTGKPLSELEKDLSMLESLIFFALKNGHQEEGQEFKIKFEEMEKIVDHCYGQIQEELPVFLEKELGVKSLNETDL